MTKVKLCIMCDCYIPRYLNYCDKCQKMFDDLAKRLKGVKNVAGG